MIRFELFFGDHRLRLQSRACTSSKVVFTTSILADLANSRKEGLVRR